MSKNPASALTSCYRNRSFIVLAPVVTNVNYDRSTFIVQSTVSCVKRYNTRLCYGLTCKNMTRLKGIARDKSSSLMEQCILHNSN